METASLRIKFTPLLNSLVKNGSKCYLEIVPEVSHVHNLDKISWKQEKDLIEYTIPMTYKITLKKRENVKKNDDGLAKDVVELNKTYHSCVDLLPVSSTLDLASGDVTRIISDTFILSKISTKVYNDKPVINDNPVNSIKAHIIEDQPNVSPKEMPVLTNIVHEQTIFVDDREDNLKDNAISGPLAMNCVIDKQSLYKITNTENALSVSKVATTQSIETITEISTRSRDDSKRKLSLSPICSIDTNDYLFSKDVNKIPLNLVVDHVLRYKKKDFNGFKLPTWNEKHINLTTMYDDNVAIENNYLSRKRELPEARVAKFIKKMETEIMPLKIMLNDILQKCSTLKLSKNKCLAPNLILYKTLSSSCKNHVEKYNKTEKQTKSNRCVYSIVFDG